MTRINVFDDENKLIGWFSDDAATAYDEDTRWDGNNHISIATGSQWEHETLYRTQQGRWVISWWSQWQGSRPRRWFVGEDEARDWLLANNHDDAVTQWWGAPEPERGPEHASARG